MGKKYKSLDRYELINFGNVGLEKKAITIDGGLISHIGERQGGMGVIDCRGCLIVPGRVETHGHDRDACGSNHEAETIETFMRAAIYGGTTTVAAMANTNPCIITADRWATKNARIQSSRINYLQFFGATPHNHGELATIYKHPDFVGAKLCTAVTTATGEMLMAKPEEQLEWCKRAADYGFRTAVHAENEARIQRNEARIRQQQIELNLTHHCQIRDPRSEVEAVQQMIDIGLRTGAALDFCHISVPKSAQLIRRAISKGLDATLEICPQHCWLSDDMLKQKEGWRFKCNPPVRSLESALAMEQILCDESFSNVSYATDHAPHTAFSKKMFLPDPIKTPSGMPGLETAFSLCWDLVRQGKMSLKRFIDVTARNPAKRLGFEKKGEVKEGYDADLVALDRNKEVRFEDKNMKTKCGWTPVHGRTSFGMVQLVICKGRVVHNAFDG